jgi:hypothetical protein
MEDEIEEIVEWGSEIHLLEEALDQSSEGLVREYAKLILDMLENIGSTSVTVPVSSKEMTGFDILYGEIQRIFSGGDNLYE